MTDASLFSPETENVVLSLLLRNPALCSKLEGLHFYMMSSAPNQVLLSEVEELVSKDLQPDFTLLLATMEANGNLKKCGGKAYLDYLINLDYPIEHFQEFVKLVISSYKARAFVSITSQIKPETLSTSNIDSKINSVREKLDDLSQATSTGDVVHIGENISNAFDEIVQRTKNPGVRGVPWNIRKIDLVTGGKNPGDVWFIGGRPGSGKTAIICNAALRDGESGEPSLIISKEMNYQTLLERFVAIDSGVGISNIRLGLLNQAQLDLVRDSLNRIKKYPIYLDTNFATDTYYVENIIRKYANKHDVKTVYIDYIQLLVERDDSMTHALGKLSRMFKLNANALGISIVTLSQLNRDVEHRDNKRPQMSDLRQSGNLEEDADIVVGLYRDEYYNKDTKYPGTMEFTILKNRNGPVGTVTLDFVAETNRVEST